ncbi:MAG: undecaprenyl-diphosphate phosphatase [Clostridia bacterium]|nr:undecaprenyl-diphosphate phosphatase [Clostridia bacterium]
MTYLEAVFLGIVQGLTEFLPISSSGHLSVAQFLMNHTGTEAMLLNVLLHAGTLIAVFVCFGREILELIREAIRFIVDIFKGRYRLAYIKEDFKEMNPNRKMLLYFVVSCVPLLFLVLPVGGGDRVMDVLSVFSTDDNIFVEGFCFIITGLMLIGGARREKTLKEKRDMDFLSAFFVGCAQMFAAAFPGVSRSGATISAGLLDGVSADYMINYTFILGIPAIIAANISELKSISFTGTTLTGGHIAVGILTAAIVGIAAIRLLKWLMKKKLFRYFGYYCVLFGAFCLGTNALSLVMQRFGG